MGLSKLPAAWVQIPRQLHQFPNKRSRTVVGIQSCEKQRLGNKWDETHTTPPAQKTIALASDKLKAFAAVSDVMPDIAEIEKFEI